MSRDIRNLNIYDLRVLARETGVKCPTSKTKEKLINEILLIESGKLQPVHCNRGRKPTHFLHEEPFKYTNQTEKTSETQYDYYINNFSDESEVDIVVSIANKADFSIYLHELLKENFVANVVRINLTKFRIDFRFQSLFIEITQKQN